MILTEYWPSMLYTTYLIDIYQMECFPLGVHGKESFMKRLSNEVTLNFFMNVSTAIPLALHWYCLLMVWAVYDHDQTLPGIVVYLQKDNEDNWSCAMPKFRYTCSLFNRVNSVLVQNHILFCNATNDCRKGKQSLNYKVTVRSNVCVALIY